MWQFQGLEVASTSRTSPVSYLLTMYLIVPRQQCSSPHVLCWCGNRCTANIMYSHFLIVRLWPCKTCGYGCLMCCSIMVFLSLSPVVAHIPITMISMTMEGRAPAPTGVFVHDSHHNLSYTPLWVVNGWSSSVRGTCSAIINTTMFIAVHSLNPKHTCI